MVPTEHTIHIHPAAPPKVAVGGACNGCGVCCLFAPCPLGILLSGRRSGACDALRWDAELAQYRCGALVAPREVLGQSLPRALRGLARPLAPVLRRLGRRWIAAGTGCDSSLEVVMTSVEAPHTNCGDAASTTMLAPVLTDHPRRTVVRPPEP